MSNDVSNTPRLPPTVEETERDISQLGSNLELASDDPVVQTLTTLARDIMAAIEKADRIYDVARYLKCIKVDIESSGVYNLSLDTLGNAAIAASISDRIRGESRAAHDGRRLRDITLPDEGTDQDDD